MSQTCDKCSVTVYRKVYERDEETGKMVGLGVDCGCKRLARMRKITNAFDITFDHVADEFGNKLHVSNIRQLEAAEKRLGFQSVVLNSDAQNFDDPPQQAPVDMAKIHNWKFSDRQRYARRFA
jgi:hypothetical protein